ncbi:Cytochrome 89A2 [Capsicum chinense]|nr:Cytochrome 89A2 [Capsicum chinense]
MKGASSMLQNRGVMLQHLWSRVGIKGFEPARPDLEIISRVYFLCTVRIPSFNLSNSIPRKYLSSPSKAKEQKLEHNDEFVASYVDTLLNLALPEENRNLNHGENVSLCSEFLSVRTDTMSTFLEWVMANLVKKPSIQEKLYQEIASVVGDNQFTEEVVKEEDLQKMPNLKAVVVEGPRRHPPSHFVLPWGKDEITKGLI